jgi:Tfp pilus assembly protein PilP
VIVVKSITLLLTILLLVVGCSANNNGNTITITQEKAVEIAEKAALEKYSYGESYKATLYKYEDNNGEIREEWEVYVLTKEGITDKKNYKHHTILYYIDPSTGDIIKEANISTAS